MQKSSRNIHQRTHPHAGISRILEPHQNNHQQNQIKTVVKKAPQKLRTVHKSGNLIKHLPQNVHRPSSLLQNRQSGQICVQQQFAQTFLVNFAEIVQGVGR